MISSLLMPPCQKNRPRAIEERLVHRRTNYEASDEWLHAKPFAEKPDGLKLIWEYTNMIFLSISSEDALKRFARGKTKNAQLNAFHDKFNTLLLSEEKATISLFRSAMGMDNFVRSF